MADIKELLGKTLSEINVTDYEIYFRTNGNEAYKMLHFQDCCEDVSVEEFVGDIEDLINSPIMMAEEVSQLDEDAWGSGTWTFYKLGTIKGCVTIRWYGQSNGYYSESVSFIKD